ncbi:hypothetical protein Lqui_2747 [Legionella quinlivanii]|uniref:Uncharacterized protein n=1 Tax=Legionella quinlivanii TaxID=45073 RepID=A0A0W0XL34_9GAMM|nr:hypothetical protein [Legionella quinlivanii]KTD45276.1 hypothetical protein Lqui_2747 [Legionella quinlivanii]SEG03118.1 hypothetical protein SAMN02746093_01679 [Legionella quinlivanii DSM 21216]STY11424.1 Uncharacterised protein [Legionella quinlivanii]
MKHYILTGFIAAAFSFSNMAHANFSLYSTNSDACQQVAGQWAGSGKATNWFIGECKYHGSGTITSADGGQHFSIEVVADKDSGSFFCPKHTVNQFTGTCVNGIATFNTEYGSIDGSFSENSGDAQGTLTVGPGMTAEVSLQFHRVS